MGAAGSGQLCLMLCGRAGAERAFECMEGRNNFHDAMT